VLTQGGSNQRTNSVADTTLTPATVSAGTFAFRWRRQVRGSVYAQPLVVTNVTMPSVLGLPPHTANLVIVATMQNRVYAFDADDTSADAAPLWKTDLGRLPGGVQTAPPAPLSDVAIGACQKPTYTDIYVSLGIEGTPVVGDDGTGTRFLYLVAHSHTGYDYFSRAGGVHSYWLYKLSLVDGSFVSAAQITGVVPGNGSGNVSGELPFTETLENQRAGLLLSDNNVYVAFSSFGDCGAWHGWLFGFAADNLAPTGDWAVTPNGARGGVWQSGMGIAADAEQSLYLTTGNGGGGSDTNAPNDNFAQSVVRLSPDLQVDPTTGWFSPADHTQESIADADLGSAGPVLFAGNRLLAGGKEGVVYWLNTTNLGESTSMDTGDLAQSLLSTGGDPQIHSIAGWDLAGAPTAYIWPNGSNLTKLNINDSTNTLLKTSGPSTDETDISLSLSTVDTTHAVLWASLPAASDPDGHTVHGRLEALDATTLAPLWDSTTAVNARDDVGIFAKFNSPTIANGSVYLGNFEGIDPQNGPSGSITSGFTTIGTPALLSVADDFLTVAFTGEDQHLYVATTTDGATFPPPHQLADTSFSGLTSAVVTYPGGNERYFIAYAGTDGNHTPQIIGTGDRTFRDGTQQFLTSIQGESTIATPRILFDPDGNGGLGLIWVFWVGTDHEINWETGDTTGHVFGTKETIPETTNAAVGAMVDPNHPGSGVVIAWGGLDPSNHINVATIPNPFSNGYTKQVFADHSVGRVILYRDPNQFLYLGFSGVSDNWFNIITAEPEEDWTGLVDPTNGQAFNRSIYIEQTSTMGFELATWRDRVYVTWEGTDSHVNLAPLSAGSIVSYGLQTCTTPPSLSVPSTFTTNNCVQNQNQLQGDVSAMSNCPGAPQVTLSVAGLPSMGVFPVGVATPLTWTATDSLGNSATAIEEVTVQGAQPFCPEATGTVMLPILATGSLLLDTNAKIVDGTTGLPATIAAGTGIVVGANAQAGSIFSDGPITLDQGAHVGAITTASTVTSATGVVQGAITPINPVLPGIAISPVFPSPQAAVDLTPNTMQTLAPGSYASLEVHPNATVTLQTGTYYFGSLYFHFSANVVVPGTGPVVIYVTSSFISDGNIEGPGTAQNLARSVALVYLGTAATTLEGTFNGTIVAPNANIVLQSQMNFTGQILSQSLEVSSDDVLKEVSFGQ
jgi:hypothetical protein